MYATVPYLVVPWFLVAWFRVAHVALVIADEASKARLRFGIDQPECVELLRRPATQALRRAVFACMSSP